jgi:hypothetical protein
MLFVLDNRQGQEKDVDFQKNVCWQHVLIERLD